MLPIKLKPVWGGLPMLLDYKFFKKGHQWPYTSPIFFPTLTKRNVTGNTLKSTSSLHPPKCILRPPLHKESRPMLNPNWAILVVPWQKLVPMTLHSECRQNWNIISWSIPVWPHDFPTDILLTQRANSQPLGPML
jgi:hypothetical protein